MRRRAACVSTWRRTCWRFPALPSRTRTRAAPRRIGFSACSRPPSRGSRCVRAASLDSRAAELLVDRLPDALDRTLDALDRDALRGHVECVQDQVSLRSSLRERGLVAFLADDSRLPRKSGADTRPLAHAVPLERGIPVLPRKRAGPPPRQGNRRPNELRGRTRLGAVHPHRVRTRGVRPRSGRRSRTLRHRSRRRERAR